MSLILTLGAGILTGIALSAAGLVLASYRAYHRQNDCPTHGRKCPGHLHLEILDDVVICHYPDGTMTATTKFWQKEES